MRYFILGIAIVMVVILFGCSEKTRTIDAELYLDTDSGTYCYQRSFVVSEQDWMDDSLGIKDSLAQEMMKDLNLEIDL